MWIYGPPRTQIINSKHLRSVTKSTMNKSFTIEFRFANLTFEEVHSIWYYTSEKERDQMFEEIIKILDEEQE